MPMSNLDYAHIPVLISSDIPKIILRAKKKVDRIAKRIQRNKDTQCPLAKMAAYGFVQMIYRLFQDKAMAVLREKAHMPEVELLQVADYLPQTDRSILIRDSCVGCGICAKVCPAQNILMENGRPVFQHRCEMCFACDEWCPVGAIQHWSRQAGVKYHYPDTQWADMLSTNDKGS
jgi:formate hydrogenlyase subunit 6/NADH:ubiquinone oxidoreductase subunit I